VGDTAEGEGFEPSAEALTPETVFETDGRIHWMLALSRTPERT